MCFGTFFIGVAAGADFSIDELAYHAARHNREHGPERNVGVEAAVAKICVVEDEDWAEKAQHKVN